MFLRVIPGKFRDFDEDWRVAALYYLVHKMRTNIWRLCLKTDSDSGDVTSSGRLFHVLALETGKVGL